MSDFRFLSCLFDCRWWEIWIFFFPFVPPDTLVWSRKDFLQISPRFFIEKLGSTWDSLWKCSTSSVIFLSGIHRATGDKRFGFLSLFFFNESCKEEFVFFFPGFRFNGLAYFDLCAISKEPFFSVVTIRVWGFWRIYLGLTVANGSWEASLRVSSVFRVFWYGLVVSQWMWEWWKGETRKIRTRALCFQGSMWTIQIREVPEHLRGTRWHSTSSSAYPHRGSIQQLLHCLFLLTMPAPWFLRLLRVWSVQSSHKLLM